MLKTLTRILGTGKNPFPMILIAADGTTYRWVGWYGCQLESFENRQILPGEERTLKLGPIHDKIHEITVFRSVRQGLFNYRTTWAVSKRGTFDEHDQRIRNLRADLRDLL